MYYVMSIPEILVLLFVIGLWMLSIFCCFKRYEKIRIIERADMPTFNKKNINNESLDTGSCLSSKNNTTNSTNNINMSLNCSPSLNKLALINNRSTNQGSVHDLNTFQTTANTYLYEKLSNQAKLPNNSNQSYYLLDETQNKLNSSIKLINYQEKIKYEKYKKNTFQIQHNFYSIQQPLKSGQNSFKRNHYYINRLNSSNQIKPFLDQAQLNTNKFISNNINCSISNNINNDISNQAEFVNLIKKMNLNKPNIIKKSKSESNLKELINNFSNINNNVGIFSNKINKNQKDPLLRSSSIDDQTNLNLPSIENNLLLTSSPNNYYYNSNNCNSTKNKLPIKNCKYNRYNKSFNNDENLLDPHLIPKVIQKSLIDLHKKSIWNLAHNKSINSSLNNTNNSNANNKVNSATKSASNIQILNSITNANPYGSKLAIFGNNININNIKSSNNSNSNVYTQHRKQNEIKMKIGENLV